MLSQHTSDINSYRAFAKLRETFPTWEEVLNADVKSLAESIKMGGLSKVKAPGSRRSSPQSWNATAPGTSHSSGKCRWPEAKKWLLELPGVGPKTVGCVLLFSLGMPAMIVDTHVHRVAKRLNLIGPRVSADDAHDILEAKVPPTTCSVPTSTSSPTAARSVRPSAPSVTSASSKTSAPPANSAASQGHARPNPNPSPLPALNSPPDIVRL